MDTDIRHEIDCVVAIAACRIAKLKEAVSHLERTSDEIIAGIDARMLDEHQIAEVDWIWLRDERERYDNQLRLINECNAWQAQLWDAIVRAENTYEKKELEELNTLLETIKCSWL